MITDFRRGKDKLQFLRSGFKPNRAGVLAKKHFRFNKQGVARDANDFFLFNTTTKTLYYDSNGNKAGGRMKIATFSNGVDIRRTDIVMA